MFNLNRRGTVRRWGAAVDTYSGVIATQVAFWRKWMQIDDRSGFVTTDEQQRTWTYDARIVMRYELSRPTKSNDTIDYEGTRYIIHSVSIHSEGRKDFEILQCSKTDEFINDIIPVATDNIKTFYYPPSGDEDNVFVVPGLKNKTIVAAFKDGLEHTVIPGGEQSGKWMVYDLVAGSFTWSQVFESGEQDALIIYY